eukprot:4330130-Pyramimonas_sp.AAC.1
MLGDRGELSRRADGGEQSKDRDVVARRLRHELAKYPTADIIVSQDGLRQGRIHSVQPRSAGDDAVPKLPPRVALLIYF